MEDRGATTRPQTNPLRSEIIMSSAAKNSKTTVIPCMLTAMRPWQSSGYVKLLVLRSISSQPEREIPSHMQSSASATV